MGNDGGSIPTRRELVREAARNPTSAELKETQQEQHEWSWKNCPLSHRQLVRPVVSDCAGRLYNKDAVLEFLLPAADGSSGKADGEEVLGGRVKGLKDVVEVRFEVDGDGEGTSGAAGKEERWVCPVTAKQLGPSVKSVYLVPCGHAFSESAVKEVSGEECLQCNEPYTADNVIPILSSAPADIERLAARTKTLKEQGVTHSLKKAQGSSKKRKKGVGVAESAQADESNGSTPRPASTSSKVTTTGIKNAATASLTAKVLQDEDERKKRQRLGMNDNLKSLFSATEGKDANRKGKGGNDFMSRGYSIPAGAKR
ncbi:MAG: hypothetical protein M1832_002716 [Thelocarpon impressellum]|nr:MAG: hypothetical protein M1832_002716 [Thelocarpon impressellum]